MQKILITYGTRPLAQRVANLLKNKYEVLFASSEEVPSFLRNTYPQIPTGVNPTFAHEILKYCLDNQIDYILPLGYSELESLAESKLLFEEYDIQPLVPNLADLPLYFVIENPGSEVPIRVYSKGQSLTDEQSLSLPATGLLLLSDNQEELAIITV